jgi:hypothetical protein
MVAFGPHGGSESITETVPGPGDGAFQTDQLPASAMQATIKVSPPTNVNQEPTFDDLVDTVITNYPRFSKVNRTAQRIIACAFIAALAGSATSNSQGDFVFTANDPTVEALALDVCLRIAVGLSMKHAADAAISTSAVCFHAERAIGIKITRTGSGYSGQANGLTHKPSRRSPVAVTCRRAGTGLQLTIRARARGRTLRQAAGPTLGIAFVNPSNKPVGVRTTFTVR